MRNDFRVGRGGVLGQVLGLSTLMWLLFVLGCGTKQSTPTPVLTITKTHTGSVTQGQQNATYTVTVSNTGTAATNGTVTVTETVPSGLTLVSLAGSGWTCAAGGNTCTRADVLASGSSYPAITVTVNVSVSASSPQVNQVSVSGGGAAIANGQDSTVILVPALSITKTHSGSFAQGQKGATYTVTVSNGASAAPTNGTTVTVTDTVPSGLTLVSMSGSGWTCPSGGTTCTRTDVLQPSSSYPTITVTANVAANATSPLVNTVTVTGGGSASANANDSTTIIASSLSITKTHSGNFAQGQVGATFTVTVSNAVGAAPTNGTTVTVVDTVPGGLTLTNISGTGWTCVVATATCTRSDALAAASSYPPITVTANVGLSASSPQVNHVSVSGGGSPTANASDSAIILTPSLSITKSHGGNFTQGQTGATYTVTVSNSNAANAGPTNGTTVTMVDTVPSGLTVTNISGTGWACVLVTATCTRTDVLAAGASYPTITVVVSVASNATTPQVNQVSVSGGGSATANASDSTTIIEPVLSIAKTHTGNFTQGQTGATYTVTVSNTGTASTSAKVTVTETVPSGLTLTGMTGTGWTCPGTAGANTCDRSDVLANGSSYPQITVTVSVGASATSPQVNAVAVSGGGSANGNTTDSTTITGGANSCPTGGSLGALTGQYAFALRGFDGSGNVALIGGVLTADGAGKLTTGAVDMNLSGGVSNLAIASGSNYTVGSDGRGCMAITTTAGTQNYRFSLGASGNGHMIDFDAAGPFTTGVLRKQTPSAYSTGQISGNYAFSISSPQDSTQGGGKAAGVGVLNLSTGSVTGGSMDYNDYNATLNTDKLDGVSGATVWPASPISISSGGSYSVSGTTGRGTLSFTPSGASAFNAYIYVVSSTEVLIIDSDARTVGNLFAGSALQQSGGPFGNTSLNGKSVVYNSKLSSNGGTPNSGVSIGIVTTTGATATFSFAGYNNGGGNISTPANNSASGTFSVAANGRVTLTVSGGGNNSPEFYLISPNNGFSVFSGNGVDSGLMEAQTSTSVSGTYAYGSIAPQSAGEKDSTGAPVFSSPNVTGTGDDNEQGTLSPNGTISNTYSVDANGVVFMPASCTPGTNCNKIGTVITSSKFVMMDAKSSSSQGGTTSPSLSVVDK